MIILTDKEINRADWKSFFNKNQFSTPFQSAEYFDFFNSVPGYSAKVFAIQDNDELHALCVVTFQKENGIKGFFSRRAIIYGGPLISSGNDGIIALKILLKTINEEVKNNAIYIEIRNLNDYGTYKEYFETSGWNYLNYLNFHLYCGSEEVAWNNFNNNRKRQIKKSLKLGVQIEEASSIFEVTEFYRILKDLYYTKIKKPLPSFEYFHRLFDTRIAKFFLVKFQEKIIGGIVCPVLEGISIYEFYICGLDQEFKDASPSVMATFAAIEYGYKNKLERFDFMGAGKMNEDYGVRDFKEKFGGKLVEHGRFFKIFNPILYQIGKFGLTTIKPLIK